MKYRTAFGDEVDVRVGDTVYVDEGDSVGCREFSGVVMATTKTVTVQPKSGVAVRVRPSEVVDLAVIHEGQLGRQS